NIRLTETRKPCLTRGPHKERNRLSPVGEVSARYSFKLVTVLSVALYASLNVEYFTRCRISSGGGQVKYRMFIWEKSFSCSTLSVPSYYATRRKHEGWDTARSPKPRQGKSMCRGRVRATNIRLTETRKPCLTRGPHKERNRLSPVGEVSARYSFKLVTVLSVALYASLNVEYFTRCRISSGGGQVKYRMFIWEKSFSCSTLSVPSYYATRRKHEGWDTARSPKPRQGKSMCRGRVRATVNLCLKH
ncbi:hypothetical protein T265_12635, partial [Opisthorchis viverrini]